MIKINKITLLMLILFGVSFAGCVTMKKVADAIVPDVLLPDSILYPDKEEVTTEAETVTPSPQVANEEEMTPKNYAEFFIVGLLIIIILFVVRFFVRKRMGDGS